MNELNLCICQVYIVDIENLGHWRKHEFINESIHMENQYSDSFSLRRVTTFSLLKMWGLKVMSSQMKTKSSNTIISIVLIAVALKHICYTLCGSLVLNKKQSNNTLYLCNMQSFKSTLIYTVHLAVITKYNGRQDSCYYLCFSDEDSETQ